ncbi:MAG: hypothetical protein RCG15_01220 [Candidatus Rickettsia vulgarisii]
MTLTNKTTLAEQGTDIAYKISKGPKSYAEYKKIFTNNLKDTG